MAKLLRTIHDDGTTTEVRWEDALDQPDAVEAYVAGLSADRLRQLVIELVEAFDPVAQHVEAQVTAVLEASGTVAGSSTRGRQEPPDPHALLERDLEDRVLEAIEELELSYERHGYISYGSALDRPLGSIEKYIDRGHAGVTRSALELIVRELTEMDLDEVDDSYGSLSDAPRTTSSRSVRPGDDCHRCRSGTR